VDEVFGTDKVRKLRKHVRAEIATSAGMLLREGQPTRAVATSKTFRQLARIAGAAPSSDGPYVKRILKHSDVPATAERLAQTTVAERSAMPGVSEGHAGQLAAGAIVADAAMDLFGIPILEIYPWALREGVILRRIDTLAILWVIPPPPWPGSGCRPGPRRPRQRPRR
jgi:exopolyphosphatase/guanosine-5'-triphosphate,3'-diphosphate pyrophosphatase